MKFSLAYLISKASGDSRNVIKTIDCLPNMFDRDIHIVMNDRELDIVARNAIILLTTLVVDDPDEAVDTIIHLWYSSLITASHLRTLQRHILPIVAEVCDKISTKLDGKLLGKTWTYGRTSMRLVLLKEDWSRLLNYLEPPPNLTADRAYAVRREVTIDPWRVDRRHRSYLGMKPAHRVSRERFQTDGLLISFGASRSDFTIPNP